MKLLHYKLKKFTSPLKDSFAFSILSKNASSFVANNLEAIATPHSIEANLVTYIHALF